MFQLCVTEPALTSATRLIVDASAKSMVKVLPISSVSGAVLMTGRGASAPAAVKRYGGGEKTPLWVFKGAGGAPPPTSTPPPAHSHTGGGDNPAPPAREPF